MDHEITEESLLAARLTAVTSLTTRMDTRFAEGELVPSGTIYRKV